MVGLGTLDVVMIGGYVLLIAAIGVYFGRGGNSAEDYFLAGRGLTWPLIGFSYYASNMSGASFVGLIGGAYQHGMVIFNYEWTATLVLVVFALFMLPVFLRARLFTMPEYLEARFDRRSRLLYAVVTLLTLILIDIAGALYAGGVVISTLSPGIAPWQASAGLAVLAGLYTLFGGLRAVVVTDVLQAVLLIIGAGILVAIGLERVGGWQAMMAAVDEGHRHLLKPADDPVLPWPGLGTVILLGFYYWTLNQYFVQRPLAARSLDHGRKGALFGGLLKLPNIVLMIVPGLLAVALLPGLDRPDEAFPRLVDLLMPSGLRGLVLVALIAAIMSSLDSALNAASSVFTMDLVRTARPSFSDRRLVVMGRLFTLLLMVAATAYTPFIAGQFDTLFEYFQATLSYIVPPIVAVYLAGLFGRRVTAGAAFWALAVGMALGLGLFVLREVTGLWDAAGLPSLHYTYTALILFALAVAMLAVGSVFDRALPDARQQGLTFRLADLSVAPRTGPLARLADDRLLSVALLAAMAGLIAIFW